MNGCSSRKRTRSRGALPQIEQCNYRHDYQNDFDLVSDADATTGDESDKYMQPICNHYQVFCPRSNVLVAYYA